MTFIKAVAAKYYVNSGFSKSAEKFLSQIEDYIKGMMPQPQIGKGGGSLQYKKEFDKIYDTQVGKPFLIVYRGIGFFDDPRDNDAYDIVAPSKGCFYLFLNLLKLQNPLQRIVVLKLMKHGVS